MKSGWVLFHRNRQGSKRTSTVQNYRIGWLSSTSVIPADSQKMCQHLLMNEQTDSSSCATVMKGLYVNSFIPYQTNGPSSPVLVDGDWHWFSRVSTGQWSFPDQLPDIQLDQFSTETNRRPTETQREQPEIHTHKLNHRNLVFIGVLNI